MFKVMLKSLKAHKGRLILTSVAVMMGVSLVTGTYVFTDTITGIFDELTAESTSGVDVYVRGTSEYRTEMTWGDNSEPIPEDVLYTVRNVPGARWVFGSVSGMAGVLDAKGDLIRNGGAPNLGFSWSPPPLAPVTLASGRPPTLSSEVALDRGTAEQGHFAIGDMVPIAVNGPVAEYELVGIVTYGRANNLAGATISVFDLEEAQRAFDKEGVFDTIEVTGDPGLDEHSLRNAIAHVLPTGYEAVLSGTIKAEADETISNLIGYINTALLVFALIALFVGAFIIFNTFSIIVAHRLREFALLRSLGASPRQVLWGVTGEALVIGVIASALGIGLGVAVAIGLKALMGAFGMDLPTGDLELLPRTIVVAMSLGVGVTLLSAVSPARRAARTPPIAMMQESTLAVRRSLTKRSIAGAAGLAAGIGAMSVGLFADVNNALLLVGVGGLAMFLGAAALSPLATGPASRLLGYVPAKLSGVSGVLARENTRTGARRTATTASALMVGVALVTFVALFSSSIKASTNTGLADSLRADLVVQESDPMLALGFSTKLATDLSELPEVAALSPSRFGEWDYNGAARMLDAVDPATIGELVDLGVLEGDVADLGNDGVLIGKDIADGDHLAVGDPLPMLFSRTGDVQAHVAGIFENYSAVNDHFVISLDMYERNYREQVDLRVYLKAADGVSPAELKSAVDGTVSTYPALSILDAEGLKDATAKQVDQMLGLVTALLGLAIFIAAIGIANTLGLSILERTRELGLLRAVGMTRRQLRTMIRWEAVIIALFGAILGLVLGLFFGWAVVSAMSEQGIDQLSVPYAQLAMYLVMGAFTGVLAATLPARRAAKLDILKAVTVE